MAGVGSGVVLVVAAGRAMYRAHKCSRVQEDPAPSFDVESPASERSVPTGPHSIVTGIQMSGVV